MLVRLAYSDSKLPELDPELATPTADMVFNPTMAHPAGLNMLTEKVKTLRGKNIKHIINKSKVHNITISADEIDSAALAFLESFWAANYQYIAYMYTYQADWSGLSYIEVYEDNDAFPVEYIEDLTMFPEVKFKLVEVEPWP